MALQKTSAHVPEHRFPFGQEIAETLGGIPAEWSTSNDVSAEKAITSGDAVSLQPQGPWPELEPDSESLA